MKKSTTAPKKTNHEKGFIALAGEAFHVLGEEIIEGKDKVLEAASEKLTAVKKTFKNLTHKKAAKPKSTIKKAANKVVKKAAKKTAGKNAVTKPTGKKVVKKATGKK